MESNLKVTLAVAVISVAAARLCLQLYEAKKNQLLNSPAAQSTWTTLAGSLTLAYAYAHDSDPILIIATWLNTVSASISLAAAIENSKSVSNQQTQESPHE